jgi:hypothetical protein
MTLGHWIGKGEVIPGKMKLGKMRLAMGDASQGDTRQNGTRKHAARNGKYKVRREKLVEVRIDKVSLG